MHPFKTLPVLKDRRLSQDVLEFADVAGPIVLKELCEKTGGEALKFPIALNPETFEYVLNQLRHIIEPLSQRW